MVLHFNMKERERERDCADTNLISTCSPNLKLVILDLHKQHLMQKFYMTLLPSVSSVPVDKHIPDARGSLY